MSQESKHKRRSFSDEFKRDAVSLIVNQGFPLRVVRAAIRDSQGGVHSVERPGRHHDVIALMVKTGHPKPISGDQGFLLSDGRFVMRKAAAKVAIAAGQCNSVALPHRGLLSEDVW